MTAAETVVRSGTGAAGYPHTLWTDERACMSDLSNTGEPLTTLRRWGCLLDGLPAGPRPLMTFWADECAPIDVAAIFAPLFEGA